MDEAARLVNQDEIERLLAQSAAPGGQASGGASGGQPAAAEGGPPEPPGQQAPGPTSGPVTDTPPSTASSSPAASSAPANAPVDDSDRLLGQQDIEKLLQQAGRGTATPKPAPPAEARPQISALPTEGEVGPADVEFLLHQAQEALASINAEPGADLPAGVRPFQLVEFGGAPASTEAASLDLIRDVELDLRIELGRAQMYLEEVLKLRKGSVVPLDKLAGDPVDIFVNGRLIARGEVLVLNDNFCVRVAELIVGTGPKS